MIRVTLFLLFISLVLAVPAHAEFRAGAAKRSIVPPFPTKMAGYFDRAEDFTGVDRTIYARALVCQNGDTAVAILVADLIGVSKGLVDDVRARAAKETGLDPENIMIAATHTHAGPARSNGADRLAYDDASPLNTFLLDTLTATLADAWKDLRPAAVGFAYGHLDGITTNRQQNNDRVIDPDVGVLKVQAKDSRETIATLANFTGHPVILGSDNLLLSCEYPGVACDTVETLLGGVAIFTQGACGDITMKRSGPPFDEVARLGRIVGGEIVATSEQIEVGEEIALGSQGGPISLEPRQLPSRSDVDTGKAAAQAALDDAKERGAAEYIVRDLQREVYAFNTTAMVVDMAAEHPELVAASAHTQYQVMQIGPLVAVAMPGELFVEYALEMKARVRQDTGRPMILVGYANDYIGYIITPRAGETGGYERAISRVAPSAGRTLTEAAMGAVRQLVTPAEVTE